MRILADVGLLAGHSYYGGTRRPGWSTVPLGAHRPCSIAFSCKQVRPVLGACVLLSRIHITSAHVRSDRVL